MGGIPAGRLAVDKAGNIWIADMKRGILRLSPEVALDDFEVASKERLAIYQAVEARYEFGGEIAGGTFAERGRRGLGQWRQGNPKTIGINL